MPNDYILFNKNEDEDIILDYEERIDWEDKVAFYSNFSADLSAANGEQK